MGVEKLLLNRVRMLFNWHTVTFNYRYCSTTTNFASRWYAKSNDKISFREIIFWWVLRHLAKDDRDETGTSSALDFVRGTCLQHDDIDRLRDRHQRQRADHVAYDQRHPVVHGQRVGDEQQVDDHRQIHGDAERDLLARVARQEELHQADEVDEDVWEEEVQEGQQPSSAYGDLEGHVRVDLIRATSVLDQVVGGRHVHEYPLAVLEVAARVGRFDGRNQVEVHKRLVEWPWAKLQHRIAFVCAA